MAWDCPKKTSGGSSEVEHRPSKSSVVGSILTRRSNVLVAQRQSTRSLRGVGDGGSTPPEGANPTGGLCLGNAPATTTLAGVVEDTDRPKFDKVAYQREYVAKWRRGLVGKKHVGRAAQ